MFGWLKKDPKAKLQQQYEALMKEARDIQRSGDIKGFAAKVAEAEAVTKEIDALESKG